ncbi:MAG: DUF2065 domain-containing protein [Pseudomonadota bacterium]
MTEILVAIAIALFLEGAAYALFPNAMKRAMLHVLAQPVATVRLTGLAVAVAAVTLMWLVKG